ncbi:hypothetical protein F2P79_003958 [Pimephales promelas]|nr:hypothetical protein F2P79_003958 [Pimephales promelas]
MNCKISLFPVILSRIGSLSSASTPAGSGLVCASPLTSKLSTGLRRIPYDGSPLLCLSQRPPLCHHVLSSVIFVYMLNFIKHCDISPYLGVDSAVGFI